MISLTYQHKCVIDGDFELICQSFTDGDRIVVYGFKIVSAYYFFVKIIDLLLFFWVDPQ